MAFGVLYLVSTPIGNLGDITYRAIEILKKVDVIACEDTRHSKILLNHYNVVGVGSPRPNDDPNDNGRGNRAPTAAVVSYHNFSENHRAPRLIQQLKEGKNIALVSDAGTPGVADPGYRLVQMAIQEGIRVESIPGPSAFLAALSVSGLPTDRFVFEGFLPVKSSARRSKLLALKNETRTVIFYESPHRLIRSLEAIQEALGDIPIVIARELTKKFEEIRRESVSDALSHFSGKKILGEFVLLWNTRTGF